MNWEGLFCSASSPQPVPSGIIILFNQQNFFTYSSLTRSTLYHHSVVGSTVLPSSDLSCPDAQHRLTTVCSLQQVFGVKSHLKLVIWRFFNTSIILVCVVRHISSLIFSLSTYQFINTLQHHLPKRLKLLLGKHLRLEVSALSALFPLKRCNLCAPQHRRRWWIWALVPEPDAQPLLTAAVVWMLQI